MRNLTLSIILALVGIASIIWAVSYPLSGLAWFPGFLVAITCFIKIYDINRSELGGGK